MGWKDFFLGLLGGTETNNGVWAVSHIQGTTDSEGVQRGSVTLTWTDPDSPENTFSITREGEYTQEALNALVALAVEERDKWARGNAIKAQIADAIESAVNAADPGPNMEG